MNMSGNNLNRDIFSILFSIFPSFELDFQHFMSKIVIGRFRIKKVAIT